MRVTRFVMLEIPFLEALAVLMTTPLAVVLATTYISLMTPLAAPPLAMFLTTTILVCFMIVVSQATLLVMSLHSVVMTWWHGAVFGSLVVHVVAIYHTHVPNIFFLGFLKWVASSCNSICSCGTP